MAEERGWPMDDIPGAVSYIYKVSATAAVNGTQFHLVYNSSGTITSDAATPHGKKDKRLPDGHSCFSSRYAAYLLL